MSDFFTRLGQEVAAELGRPSGRYPNNPDVRQELANIMGVTLNDHLQPPPTMAKDSSMPRYSHPMLRGAYDQADMPVRGEQQYSAVDQAPNGDPSSAPPSAEELLEFVKICMQKCPDRQQFVEGLAELISTETGNGGMDNTLEITHKPNNGNGGNGLQQRSQQPTYGDRARRGARDGVIPPQQQSMDRRRPAQDAAIVALNQKSFARRFPDAMNIKFSGTGR